MNPQLVFHTWGHQPTWEEVKEKLSSLRKDASENNAYIYHVHTGKDDFAPSPPLEVEEVRKVERVETES